MLTRLHSATPILRVVTAIAFLVGVFVWPMPKEALAWPTNVTVYLEDLGVPIVGHEGAELIVTWLDAGGNPLNQGFQLFPIGNGKYITSSNEAEPDEDAVSYHVTFQWGDGWIPEDPDDFGVTMPLVWDEENILHWEVQEG